MTGSILSYKPIENFYWNRSKTTILRPWRRRRNIPPRMINDSNDTRHFPWNCNRGSVAHGIRRYNKYYDSIMISSCHINPHSRYIYIYIERESYSFFVVYFKRVMFCVFCIFSFGKQDSSRVLFDVWMYAWYVPAMRWYDQPR